MGNKNFYLQYFFNYFAFAVLVVNMIPFLNSMGFDSISRGILFGVSALFGIVMQFVIGYVCDRFKIVKKVCIVLEIMIVVSCFLFYRNGSSLCYYLISICALNGLYKAIYNLMDSWVLESDANDIFGKCRAWGALGFTIGSLGSTFFIRSIGYSFISYLVLIGMLISILFATKIREPHHKNGVSQIQFHDFKNLFCNKFYLWFLFIFLLINFSATADQYTTVDKLLGLGATEVQIGLKWGIQSISEVPLFLYGDRLLKKCRAVDLLIVGTILYIGKFILYGIVDSVDGLLWVTTLQSITYPLITLSSRIIIYTICKDSKLNTSTQLIASGIYLGISALLSPLIGGYLVESIGSTFTLYFLGAFLLIPLCLSVWIRRDFI